MEWIEDKKNILADEALEALSEIQNRLPYDIDITIGRALGKLKNLEQAEQEGRLKELPCKVGSLVYEPNIGRRYVSTYEIKEIGIGKNGIEFFYWTLIDGICSNLNGTEPCNIGKTVFLTLEEAEKALESEGE